MHGAIRLCPDFWKYTASIWDGGTQFSRTNRTRRPTNTERHSGEYITPRRSLSVRFATPAIPGRPEKLLSESGSRPARGPEPVRCRFGSASVVPLLAVNDEMDASR